MKILHFADLHLGVETYGKTDPSSGLSTRFMDFLNSFDQLVKYAIENDTDVVLFCGDAYKSRDPSQTQQREFARRIQALTESGIEVFLLVGNHDLPNAYGRATTADIFGTLRVNHVTVANSPGFFHLETASGPLQVVALPWLKRANILSKEERKNLPLDKVMARMQEVLTSTISRFSSQVNPAIPVILAAHVWVEGAGLGSENSMTVGREQMLLPSVVADPIFDYVALGHIHRSQVLRQENPPVVYSGSLDSLDFGDEGVPKGFFVVDINTVAGNKEVYYRFQPVQGRRFITLKAEITSDEMFPTEKILRLLNERRSDIADNIIRLEIGLSRDALSLLRESEIRQAASDAYHFVIIKNVQREVRVRPTAIAAETVAPLEALKQYIRANSAAYSVDRIGLLEAYAEDIINRRNRY